MAEVHNDPLKHRKGSRKVTIRRKDGTPVKNQEVAAKQVSHEFLFGCTEFSVIPYVNGWLQGRDRELAEERFRLFLDVFNYTTLPFYWGRFEPVRGNPETESYKKASNWLIERGVVLKGHPLCWHTATAPWLLELSNRDILAVQLNRIRRDVTNFAGIVDIWDVINEVVIMPIFDKYDNGITRICKELGRIRLVREVFAAAKKANPDAVLLINDFETSESYEILIEGCLEAGVPIDAIGIQSHMHQGYWGVEKTQRVLERYSRFNLPLHFTENTLVSGHLMPPHIIDLNDYVVDEWPSTPEGLERQASELETHYRTLFADPHVESITWWGFTDGGWLKAPSGLVTTDSKAKPAYEALRRLVKDEWWTKPAKLVTDETGSIVVSGFRGDYEIEVMGEKAKVTVGKDIFPAEIVL
ncbi:MAG: 1,4-beta-xylanase [Clostridiaceae bacterium]|jgi:GH35 family endo-1,4-beta-xylanase|nr:1,4-beta-xylanase [Clostridiaceae bacterium]